MEKHISKFGIGDDNNDYTILNVCFLIEYYYQGGRVPFFALDFIIYTRLK